jgi:hypothetical protein
MFSSFFALVLFMALMVLAGETLRAMARHMSPRTEAEVEACQDWNCI